MTIETQYYGTIEYGKEDLLVFPDGLFGFPKLTEYIPLYIENENDAMLLLQSAQDPFIAFVVATPSFLCPDYSPILTKEELAYLKAEDSGSLSYYVICTIKDHYLDNTVNLKCPLAINPETRVGMQVILSNSAYEYRHRFGSFPAVTGLSNEEEKKDYADSQT